MNTGVSISKAQKRISTITTITGSVAIIGLAIAFITTDFNGMLQFPSFMVNDNAISALQPLRSDPRSEPDAGLENASVFNDDSESKTGSDSDNNAASDNQSNHGLPCLDPNCVIHHPADHDTPCNNPDCSICSNLPPVEISMETISFKPDSCEYVDENAAITVLDTYVDSFEAYFERYPDGKIYLVGGIAKTASWHLNDTELSQQRAEKVKESFVSLGVDTDKLVAIGLGVSDPWRSDEWSKGYFDEQTAKINRRVWIIPDKYERQVDLVISIEDMINRE